MKQLNVELQGTFGTDRDIASAAWTSSTEHQKKTNRSEEDVARIVNMLADLKHSVPFESIVFRFWIKMPIATDRQFMTHRLQSASGMSGRYRTMPSEWQEMPDDVIEIFTKAMGQDRAIQIEKQYDAYCKETNNYYKAILETLKKREKEGKIENKEYKRAREFFRGILPQNNMTERVTVMNLRAFSNFIKLRNNPDAQVEIRQIAQMMLEEVKKANNCPIALAALERNKWSI